MKRIVQLSILILAIQMGSADARAQTGETALPPSGNDSTGVLDASPRHGEPVEVSLPGSDQTVRTWVYYPERSEKAPVVIVIHEIFGLTDWIRSVADRLAGEGFIAVAPDLISGKGPGGGGTDSVESVRDVVALVRGLGREEVTTRLNAVRDYAIALPAASEKSATIGFCWGGGQSFAYGAAQGDLNAAVVYYGTSPDASTLASISAPVLGLYGADDARVTATIPPADEEMKRLGKSFEHVLYEGAGHGFLRAQEGRDGANLRATQKAWPRTIDFLRRHME